MNGKRSDDDTALADMLLRAREFNRSQGMLTWGDEAMARTDDFLLPSLQHPRLFISYRWGDYELESWLDWLTRHLVVRGYHVVYDRDPRNFEARQSRDAVLQRMDLCNYYVAVLNEDFEKRVRHGDLGTAGALTHEWEHAMARARFGNLQVTAIWFSGESLSPPFDVASVIDLRPVHNDNFWGDFDRFFPDLQMQGSHFEPPLVPLDRLPTPELLHRSGNLIADRYRRVMICAWKADGTCDRLGPYLIRQLERIAAELHAKGYARITTEPAGAVDDD